MKSLKYSISELALEFQISTRTIRFYEEKGLLLPERKGGGQRSYKKKDRARLKLILRGKHFGLSLDEIVQILGKADNDLSEKEQTERAIYYGAQYLEKVRSQMRELKKIEKEMLEHRQSCLQSLKKLAKNPKSANQTKTKARKNELFSAV